MQVRRFDHKTDVEIIRRWLLKRDIPGYLVENVPHLGFIAFSDNKPVAAGFLRACEGKYGIADSFVTNPDESPETRDAAMDAVLTQVLAAAKELNIRALTAYSTDGYTIERAKRHGFEAQPFAVLTMNLKEVA